MTGIDRLRDQLVAALKESLRRKRSVAVPEAGRLLWSAFHELDATRGYGESGPHPITFAEIDAWCRLTRTPLAPHHVAIVRAMDSALIGHVVAEAKKAAERRR